MNLSLLPRAYARFVAVLVVTTLVFHLSPLAVFAQTPVAPAAAERAKAVAPVVAQLKNDLSILQSQGREAYISHLFDRLDADEAKGKDMIWAGIERIGARTLWMVIVGWSNPVLTAALAVVPEPWQAAALNYALCRFLHKTIVSMKETIVRTSTELLHKGLAGLVRLLTDDNFLAGHPQFARDDDPWWESFFGNSTVVKNFIITIVALGSIGTAIGLAIAGSTAAPIVAVVGALVGLIALVTGDKDAAATARCDGGDCPLPDDGDCPDGGCPLPDGD